MNTAFEETLKDTNEANTPVSTIEQRGDGQSKPVLDGRTYSCYKADSVRNGRAKQGEG